MLPPSLCARATNCWAKWFSVCCKVNDSSPFLVRPAPENPSWLAPSTMSSSAGPCPCFASGAARTTALVPAASFASFCTSRRRRFSQMMWRQCLTRCSPADDDDERHAIIIDDAELLQPDAVQYLRLVSNIVPEQMPPVVLIGRSSFWDMPGQPASSDAHDLLTCRMELERLSDEEAHAFIRETLPDAAAHALLGDAACEALVRHADGSIGRLAALLTAARDMPGAADKPGDRPIIIDQADGPKPVLTIDEPAAGHSAWIRRDHPAGVRNRPEPGRGFSATRAGAKFPTLGFRGVRYATAAVMMLTAVAAVAYWQLAIHSGADPMGRRFRCTGVCGIIRRGRCRATPGGAPVIERGDRWQRCDRAPGSGIPGGGCFAQPAWPVAPVDTACFDRAGIPSSQHRRRRPAARPIGGRTVGRALG